jgi:hypothetical protein
MNQEVFQIANIILCGVLNFQMAYDKDSITAGAVKIEGSIIAAGLRAGKRKLKM